MTKRRRWAGWITITALTWLVGTAAGVLWFVPRESFVVDDGVPNPPPVAATPQRAVASFPGCVESARWPKDRPADWVVVAWPDGRVERMRFDDAWTRGTNTTHADDVWVIGVCDPSELLISRRTMPVTSSTSRSRVRDSRLIVSVAPRPD